MKKLILMLFVATLSAHAFADDVPCADQIKQAAFKEASLHNRSCVPGEPVLDSVQADPESIQTGTIEVTCIWNVSPMSIVRGLINYTYSRPTTVEACFNIKINPADSE